MDNIEQLTGTISNALHNLGQEVTSLWLFIQIGLILLAAVAGYLTAALIRHRVHLTSVTMGWPPLLRQFTRHVLANLATLVFVVVVALMHAAMESLTWPSRSYLLGVAASLATAWVVIALVAGLIRNQFAYRLVAISAWAIAALSIVGLLHPVEAALDAVGVVIGGLRVTPLLVIKTTALLLFTLWAANAASDFLERRVRAAADLTPSIQVLIGKLIRLLLITFAIVIALSTVGIDFSALAFFSGAVGVGLGFGLQKIVSNLVSGIILLADKSIKPGDVITVGDSFGWVGSMGARYTSVVTRDGREFLIPNEDFVTQRVINWSYSNEEVRTRCRVRRRLCLRPAQGDRAGAGGDQIRYAYPAGAASRLPPQRLRRFLARLHPTFLDPRSSRRPHQCARPSAAGAVGCVQARGHRNPLPAARPQSARAVSRID